VNSRFETVLTKITEKFPRDRICPGLVCSWIPARKEYYISLVRYESGKQVIAKCYNISVEKGLREIEAQLANL
jgi:hypothetical protein